VATVALGFSGDAQVVGPLLNALADPDSMVSDNALVGLGVLASPDTPLARICFILTDASDPYTRNNAAFAMAAIIAAGGGDACALPSCRQALIDDEPGVRLQAATILGMLNDLDSIQALGDLLYDDTPLVSHASAAALSAIGREALEQKGTVARLIMDAAVRRTQGLSDRILAEVRRMTDNDYGDDLKLWTEWAYRLP
jgi:HEAT repeat protein